MRDVIVCAAAAIFILIVVSPIVQTCTATSPHGPRIGGVILIAGCP